MTLNPTVAAYQTIATVSVIEEDGEAVVVVAAEGPPGSNAAIVGVEVETLAPGAAATAENVGTSMEAVLRFGIPRGDAGDKGDQGDAGPPGPTTIAAADITDGTAAGRSLLTAADATAQRTALGLGTAATTDATDYATALQGTDSREWTAATVEQAEAEAGTATTRRAWTAQRVFQAAAAWWAASAAASKLAGVASGATANSSDATLLERANHTGTQGVGTITGLATVATSGSYSDLSSRPTLGGAAALSVGTTAGTVAAGDDSRLSDARTPTAHNQAASTISDSTAAGRALLTAADAAAQRTALGLGSAAQSSVAARQTVSSTTGSLANAASADFTLTTGKLSQLLAVTLSHQSWVRFYRSAAQRTADVRTVPGGTLQALIDLGDTRPYAEIVTTGATQTVTLNPVSELPGDGSGLVYVRLRNDSGGSAAITIDCSILTLEN